MILYVVLGVVGFFAVAGTGIFLIIRCSEREDELTGVNNWFTSRMLTYSLRPLLSNDISMIGHVMELDEELWYYLYYGHEVVDRGEYCCLVTELGKYLRVFSPSGARQSEFRPALCYGILSKGRTSTFQTWIEFRYHDEDWVLTEDHDGTPEIVRLKKDRIGRRRVLYRKVVYLSGDQ